MAEIKITIKQLELFLIQHKAKVVENIRQSLGSGDTVQHLRGLQLEGWKEKEAALHEDIKRIAENTSLPYEVEILKKFLADGKD